MTADLCKEAIDATVTSDRAAAEEVAHRALAAGIAPGDIMARAAEEHADIIGMSALPPASFARGRSRVSGKERTLSCRLATYTRTAHSRDARSSRVALGDGGLDCTRHDVQYTGH
jgi:hypothetical protein